jgi:hypothetical protein
MPLDAAAFTFVNHVARGLALAAAYDAVEASQGGFDLATLLARLFAVHAFAAPGAA